MTRLGDFLKFLVTNCHTIVAQICDDLWDYFERHHNLSKTQCIQFGQHLDKIGLIFVPTSGHADARNCLKHHHRQKLLLFCSEKMKELQRMLVADLFKFWPNLVYSQFQFNEINLMANCRISYIL